MVKTFKILFTSIIKICSIFSLTTVTLLCRAKTGFFSQPVTWYPLKKLFPYFPTLRSPQPLVITIILFNFYEINFVRFHRWVRSCGVCLSVPDLFNLAYYFQVLPMLFKITMFQSFYDQVLFHIYIHSSVSGYLGLFLMLSSLAFVTSPTINTRVHIFLQHTDFISFGYGPNRGITDHMVALFLLRSVQYLSQKFLIPSTPSSPLCNKVFTFCSVFIQIVS